MASSRAHKFSPELYHLSLICKALSHPARIEIIKLLDLGKSVTFKELKKNIPLQESTFSQHLRILKEMNIIIHQQEYPYEYTLNNDLRGTCKEIIEIIKRTASFTGSDAMNDIRYMDRLRQSISATTI